MGALSAQRLQVQALAYIILAGMSFGLVSPTLAHTLDDLEAQLLRQEAYVEITDRPAPAFTLRDPAGQPVSLANYEGKVVVLWFFYTFCPDVCPLHSEAVAEIQEKISTTPMRDLVQFIGITSDPARDLPEYLVDYGPAHGLDAANAVFLTSGPESDTATRTLAEQYGLAFTRIDEDYLAHGVVTHLIDKRGRLRARYHGLDFNPTNMIVHINGLTNEHVHDQDLVGTDERSLWAKLLQTVRGWLGPD